METTEAKARNTLLRYYKREKITLECQTITEAEIVNGPNQSTPVAGLGTLFCPPR